MDGFACNFASGTCGGEHSCVALSPTREVICYGTGNILTVWDWRQNPPALTYRPIATEPNENGGRIVALGFSCDGRSLVTVEEDDGGGGGGSGGGGGGGGGILRLWDVSIDPVDKWRCVHKTYTPSAIGRGGFGNARFRRRIKLAFCAHDRDLMLLGESVSVPGGGGGGASVHQIQLWRRRCDGAAAAELQQRLVCVQCVTLEPRVSVDRVGALPSVASLPFVDPSRYGTAEPMSRNEMIDSLLTGTPSSAQQQQQPRNVDSAAIDVCWLPGGGSGGGRLEFITIRCDEVSFWRVNRTAEDADGVKPAPGREGTCMSVSLISSHGRDIRLVKRDITACAASDNTGCVYLICRGPPGRLLRIDRGGSVISTVEAPAAPEPRDVNPSMKSEAPTTGGGFPSLLPGNTAEARQSRVSEDTATRRLRRAAHSTFVSLAVGGGVHQSGSEPGRVFVGTLAGTVLVASAATLEWQGRTVPFQRQIRNSLSFRSSGGSQVPQPVKGGWSRSGVASPADDRLQFGVRLAPTSVPSFTGDEGCAVAQVGLTARGRLFVCFADSCVAVMDGTGVGGGIGRRPSPTAYCAPRAGVAVGHVTGHFGSVESIAWDPTATVGNLRLVSCSLDQSVACWVARGLPRSHGNRQTLAVSPVRRRQRRSNKRNDTGVRFDGGDDVGGSSDEEDSTAGDKATNDTAPAAAVKALWRWRDGPAAILDVPRTISDGLSYCSNLSAAAGCSVRAPTSTAGEGLARDHRAAVRLTTVALDPMGAEIVCGSEAGDVRVFNARSGALKHLVRTPASHGDVQKRSRVAIRALEFSDNGQFLACGHESGWVGCLSRDMSFQGGATVQEAHDDQIWLGLPPATVALVIQHTSEDVDDAGFVHGSRSSGGSGGGSTVEQAKAAAEAAGLPSASQMGGGGGDETPAASDQSASPASVGGPAPYAAASCSAASSKLHTTDTFVITAGALNCAGPGSKPVLIRHRVESLSHQHQNRRRRRQRRHEQQEPPTLQDEDDSLGSDTFSVASRISTGFACAGGRWGMMATSEVMRYRLDGPCAGAAVHPSGLYLVAMTQHGSTVLYDIWTGELRGVFIASAPLDGSFSGPKFDPAGIYLVCATAAVAQSDGDTMLREKSAVFGHDGAADGGMGGGGYGTSSFAFEPVASALGYAESGEGGPPDAPLTRLAFHELATGSLAAELCGLMPVRCFAWSSDGSCVAVGCADGSMSVWQLPRAMQRNIDDVLAVVRATPLFWSSFPLYIDSAVHRFSKKAEEEEEGVEEEEVEADSLADSKKKAT